MSETTSPSPSELLKAEGNALFVNNDFTGAYQKYTEAIKHDSNNAVLYCNRAACAFGLGRYMDASTDATKVHTNHAC
uniref:Transcriptional repressor n=1 Tax=Ganoderma boninense TaxID=34458 RepID=A0A5K1JSZ9_9APHY|nr:Putative transcriptional repressor [Ganoderma boninense]